MKKSIVGIAVVTTLLCVSLHAKTIGFSCIQNADAPDESDVLTTVMETVLFDRCFDEGFIVTGTEYSNGGYQNYKNEAKLEKQFSYPIDYIVAIYSEYQPLSTTGADAIKWTQLHWKVIDFSSHTVIHKGSVVPETIKENNLITKAHSLGTMIAKSILGEVLTQ